MADLALSFDVFTYEDYKSWPESVRCELIDGVVYMMSAPSLWHQLVSTKLGRQLDEFFEGKSCTAFGTPIDVRLFPKSDNSDDVIVQPDLAVVCDDKKLSDGQACKGPPDLVIEILSQATKSKDLSQKFNLYQKAGVREYWIVGSDGVKAHTFETGETRGIDFKLDRELESLIFPGLVLKF